jgi:hypothetical protein
LPYATPAKIRENVPAAEGVCLTGSYTDVCQFKPPYQVEQDLNQPGYFKSSGYSSGCEIHADFNHALNPELFSLDGTSNVGFAVSASPSDSHYKREMVNFSNTY